MQNIQIDKVGMPLIRTPDHRLRVFVSSTMRELAPEREVVREAIDRLRLVPVLFELGARPHPPQDLYRAYLAQSHIFIGIYWQSYGWVGPGMNVSGLEDEYWLSGQMPRLVYIKNPAPEREQRLKDFLARVQDENSVSYKYFSTPEELAELVANDLVLLLTERFEQSLPGEMASDSQPTSTPTNLPVEMTRFIGRETQIASVSALLEQEHTRLFTLSGPGGVGKTRFALRVGSDLVDKFQDGVWWVEFAPLTNPSLVPQYVMNVLGIREDECCSATQMLVDHLRDKELLLILDNCEHLIQDIAQLAEALLRGSPDLKILATSREPLGVSGERVWSIPPLSIPDANEEASIEKLMQSEAIRLFTERAVAVRTDFTLTGKNAAAVAQICTHLDGIPLAIELAAARVRVLSVEEIAERLDDCFKLLVGNRTTVTRQKTLGNLIDWSYNLLPEDERALFRRLAVFTGGWTLQAAEEVCPGDDLDAMEVLDLLTHLVDKSLVVAEPQDGGERYRFLETIRQYARERLVEHDEEGDIVQRHAGYFTKMAEGSYGELWGPRQGVRLAKLEAEHDNLRAALEWLTQEPSLAEMLLRLAGSLWRFWEVRGYISEGRAWLERALANNPTGSAYYIANALRGAGNLARQQGDYEQATAMHEKSLALFRELGYKLSIARELDVLAEIAHYRGDYSRAVELHNESLALGHETGDKEGIAVSLGQLGAIARDHGDYQRARELLEESLKLCRELDDRLLIAQTLNNLGLTEHPRCEYERATEYLEEAVSLYRELNDTLGISNTLQNIGNVAKDQGRFKQAKALYNECLELKKKLGDKRGVARATVSLSEVNFLQGNYPEAGVLAEDSLKLFQALGIKRGTVYAKQMMAYVAVYQGNYDRARSLTNECLALAYEVDSPRAVAYAKESLGLCAYAQGKLTEARELLLEAFQVFHQYGDRNGVAFTSINLARTAYRQGDYDCAKQFLEDSLTISSELKTLWVKSFVLEVMGLLKRNDGDSEQASDLFMESLSIAVEQENQQGIANCLGALAGLALLDKKPARAASLFAHAESIRDSMGVQMGNDDQAEYEGYLARLRNQLDDEAFESAWAEGSAMTAEQLVTELEAGQSFRFSQLVATARRPQD